MTDERIDASPGRGALVMLGAAVLAVSVFLWPIGAALLAGGLPALHERMRLRHPGVSLIAVAIVGVGAALLVVAMLTFAGVRLANTLGQFGAFTLPAERTKKAAAAAPAARRAEPGAPLAAARSTSRGDSYEPQASVDAQLVGEAPSQDAPPPLASFVGDEHIAELLRADPTFARGAAELIRDPDAEVRREAATLLRDFGVNAAPEPR